jgi:hypothetical protein
MNFIEVFGRTIDRLHKRPLLVDPDGRLVVNQKRELVELTKIIPAAGNYAAEDVISESTSLQLPWIFPTTIPQMGWGAITRGNILISTTGLLPKITLDFYAFTPTCEMRDNVAATGILAADRYSYIGRIDFPALEDLGGCSNSLVTPNTYGNAPLEFQVRCPQQCIYAVAVLRDAETNEAANMTMNVKLVIAHLA